MKRGSKQVLVQTLTGKTTNDNVKAKNQDKESTEQLDAEEKYEVRVAGDRVWAFADRASSWNGIREADWSTTPRTAVQKDSSAIASFAGPTQ